MSEIQRFGPPPARDLASETARRAREDREFGAEGRQPRSDAGVGRDGFEFGTGPDPRDDPRKDLFSDAMRRATQSEDSDRREATEQRLLAVAERSSGLPAPEPARADSLQDAGGSRLSARVEDALAQALRGLGADRRGAEPIVLRFDAADSGRDGVTSVVVSFGADGIDVTLHGDGLDASAEFLQAAQALAERLQSRFSQRTVRVFQADGRAGPAEGEEPKSTSLSELFSAPRGGRS